MRMSKKGWRWWRRGDELKLNWTRSGLRLLVIGSSPYILDKKTSAWVVGRLIRYAVGMIVGWDEVCKMALERKSLLLSQVKKQMITFHFFFTSVASCIELAWPLLVFLLCLRYYYDSSPLNGMELVQDDPEDDYDDDDDKKCREYNIQL